MRTEANGVTDEAREALPNTAEKSKIQDNFRKNTFRTQRALEH